MAAHSSVLDWRIPGTEEPGGLPSLVLPPRPPKELETGRGREGEISAYLLIIAASPWLVLSIAVLSEMGFCNHQDIFFSTQLFEFPDLN